MKDDMTCIAVSLLLAPQLDTLHRKYEGRLKMVPRRDVFSTSQKEPPGASFHALVNLRPKEKIGGSPDKANKWTGRVSVYTRTKQAPLPHGTCIKLGQLVLSCSWMDFLPIEREVWHWQGTFGSEFARAPKRCDVTCQHAVPISRCLCKWTVP